MMIRSPRVALTSPMALSWPVLMLQTPIAVVIAISTSRHANHHRPMLALAAFTLFMAGATLCFVLGKLALANIAVLQKFREVWVFFTWLSAGVAAICLAPLIQVDFGGGVPSALPQLILVPLAWTVTFCVFTLIVHARHEVTEKLHQLKETTEQLQLALQSDEQALVLKRTVLESAIAAQITPELDGLVSTFRSLKSSPTHTEMSRLLAHVDQYLTTTIRPAIDSLSDLTTSIQPREIHALAAQRPKMTLKALELDPSRSLRMTVACGLAMAIPTMNPQKITSFSVNTVSIFAVLFCLDWVRRRRQWSSTRSSGGWVVAGCFAAVLTKLGVTASINSLGYREYLTLPPLLSGCFFALAVFLGSLERGFITLYTRAAAEQAGKNTLLQRELARIASQGSLVRREITRLLHGTVQSAFAAVRMKLQLMLAEAPNTPEFKAAADVHQLEDLLSTATQMITGLGQLAESERALHPLEAISSIAQRWRGIVDVSFSIGPQAESILYSDASMLNRVVSAAEEAVTNASRHGRATEVTIVLDVVHNQAALTLVARNDGLPPIEPVSPGVGLQAISIDQGNWFLGVEDGTTVLTASFPIPASVLTGV